MSQPTSPEPALGDKPYDCLVISDLHLGSEVCQAQLLESFLEWAVDRTRVLVINGDIFDDLNFRRLTKRHFACLKIIRKNSDRDDLHLVWIRGNHDGPADIISHIVGVEIIDEYIYQNDKLRLLILHGDQFDNFITKYRWLTEISCGIFFGIQRIAPHRTARWVRRVTKKWQRNSQLVERSAIEYARSKGCDYVTCGHTHLPLTAEADGIVYFNTGTWTEAPPCPFLAVKGGEIRLETWPSDEAEPAGQRGAGAESSESIAPATAEILR
jgi:UDP-2,3-diacylglucosamine pyrophosphatase LpxH